MKGTVSNNGFESLMALNFKSIDDKLSENLSEKDKELQEKRFELETQMKELKESFDKMENQTQWKLDDLKRLLGFRVS